MLVVVQPTGLQGKIYNAMLYIQNYVPVIYTYKAVTVAKTTGMTGLRIITGAPLTFVGATYLDLGGLVCGYFGTVAGNNTVGTIFNASSYLLTRPMWGGRNDAKWVNFETTFKRNRISSYSKWNKRNNCWKRH